MRKLLNFCLLTALIATNTVAMSYSLPQKAPDKNISSNLQTLQEMSKGVTELATKSSSAIVFVSVSKNIQGVPFGQVDPFEFFFGPQFRQKRPEKKQKGLGSGFIVDLDKGYVVTNNHVIEGADEISLKLANGKVYKAKVLGRDKNTDVAVVQIKDDDYEKKGISQLTLGNSDSLQVGEFVLALGAPFGLESSLSFGVISARDRTNLNITALGNFLQTDAAINPGNSGGPLINSSGQVIGMNTAIYSRSGSSAGIGFAVPSNIVRSIANQLIDTGGVTRGYLGVRLQPLSPDMAVGFGLPEDAEGVIVSYVQPGTPASKAGLEDGDIVIQVEDKKVTSQEELQSVVGLRSPGSKIKIVYYRDGKKRSTVATLANFPNEENLSNNSNGVQRNTETAGMSLKALNKSNLSSLQQKFQFTSTQGLLVVDVSPDSRAAQAGLRPGDVILKINKQPTRKVTTFTKAYSKKSKSLVQLERRGNFHFTTLKR